MYIEIDLRTFSWSSNVRDVLQSTGFADFWLFPELLYIKMFIYQFRQIFIGQCISNWSQDVNASNSGRYKINAKLRNTKLYKCFNKEKHKLESLQN